MLKSSAHACVETTPPDSAAPTNQPYWIGIMKLAATDWSMAAADVACQLERNLVARTGRALGLESDDRVVLGLTV